VSLINKMLQDLESRKDSQAGTTPKKSVYEDLKPIGRIPSSRAPSRRLVLLLVLVAAVGGGAYAWTQWGDTLVASLLPDKPAVRPAPVVARKAPPPKPAPDPAASPPPVAVQAADSMTPSQAMAEKQAATPAIVPQAPAVPPAIAEERSAGPTPVSTADPRPATVGAPKLASAKENNYWTVSRGETLYGISAKTGVGLRDLSSWNALSRKHVIHPGQKLRLTPPSTATTKAEPTRAKETRVALATKAKTPNSHTASPVEKIPESKLGPVSVSSDMTVMDKRVKPFSPNEKAESEYRRAADLLQKGRMADAEKHLKLALKVDEKHTPARELIAGVMLQQGHWREAQRLLEQGIDTVPAHYPFAQLLARVNVEHGADQKALAVMEASLRAGAENPEYLAFLAALYQRVGKHAEAIKAYNGALTLAPQEGRWWLGMGISLEAVQDWNTAGSAYQRAIESGVLEEKLLTYARQRLAILKKQ
jgi:MSHA biogenesis protein MshN